MLRASLAWALLLLAFATCVLRRVLGSVCLTLGRGVGGRAAAGAAARWAAALGAGVAASALRGGTETTLSPTRDTHTHTHTHTCLYTY